MVVSHRLQQALQSQLGVFWQRSAGRALSAEEVGVTLCLSPQKVSHAEGYQLSARSEGVAIETHDEMALYLRRLHIHSTDQPGWAFHSVPGD